MDFTGLDIAISYKSGGGKDAFAVALNKLLPHTKLYRRSVGFFSSSVFDFIGEGVLELARNGGKIQLATCPRLSDEDIEAINAGYVARQKLYEELVVSDLENSLINISDENAELLFQLVKEKVLDVKIVVKNGGIYHDKLALLEDFNGNTVACVGSMNETGQGYYFNYEKVRVYKSWLDQEGRIADETEEFNRIWCDENGDLEVLDFSDAFQKELIERVKHEGSYHKKSDDEKSSSASKYVMRDYQEEARNNWIKNGYNGFFVMATGTGKTITSLYSIKDLIETNHVLTIITVPYKHLVAQWYEDAKEFFPCASIEMIHGEITDGETRIYSHYLAARKEYKPLIVITTMKSFFLPKYASVYNKIDYDKLLIVDEAHNFINSISDELSLRFKYKLGLSATPVFGKDETKTKALVDWFGGIVEDFPIEKAIGKYLVNYEYHPIFVKATEQDEKNFAYYSKKMAAAFNPKTNQITDPDKFAIAYRGRLNSISMAENKMNQIESIFNEINDTSHTIIYCSDGRTLFRDVNNGEEEEVRHLEAILKLINRSIIVKDSGLKASKFTATENIETRLKLIDDFNEERINYLVAIRCLDEGINIPSITSALILSSNDNYREFVQRRGRILRLYENPISNIKKTLAHIYDVVVLPSLSNRSFASIELRRFYEYGKLASNGKTLQPKLKSLLTDYNLSMEDILFDNDYVNGGDLDD